MGIVSKKLLKQVSAIVQHELEAKHWGTMAPGKSPSGVDRFYVFDYRALGLVTGIYRYKLKDLPVSLFYRGQTKDFPASASIFEKLKMPKKKIKHLLGKKQSFKS